MSVLLLDFHAGVATRFRRYRDSRLLISDGWIIITGIGGFCSPGYSFCLANAFQLHLHDVAQPPPYGYLSRVYSDGNYRRVCSIAKARWIGQNRLSDEMYKPYRRLMFHTPTVSLQFLKPCKHL